MRTIISTAAFLIFALAGCLSASVGTLALALAVFMNDVSVAWLGVGILVLSGVSMGGAALIEEVEAKRCWNGN